MGRRRVGVRGRRIGVGGRRVGTGGRRVGRADLSESGRPLGPSRIRTGPLPLFLASGSRTDPRDCHGTTNGENQNDGFT